MNAGTFRYLAAVSDLAKLDLEVAGVTLRAADSAVEAVYAGNYARGKRRAEYDGKPFEISVSASRFKAIAGMFASDDEEIRLEPIGDSLRVSSRVLRVTLQQWGAPSDAPLLDTSNIELAGRMPAGELISEVETAIAFVSDSQMRQELTGIRLDFMRGALRIMAYDGAAVAFESTIPMKTRGEGTILVPSQDFLLGARLIATGDAIIAKPQDAPAIAIYNDTSLFRSSALSGSWPDLSRLFAKRKTARFQVEAATIRNICAAAKAFESGPDVRVTPVGELIRFDIESESGKFTAAVKGSISSPLIYDVDALSKAVRIGAVLNFDVPSEAWEPTVISCDRRKCWVVTRV